MVLISSPAKETGRVESSECASRSLAEVEKRYPQIDREALAIRWACEQCYLYLAGSSFVIETDHQPLLPLFNNSHSRPPIELNPGSYTCSSLTLN